MEQRTTTGKEMTYTVSFRLTLFLYDQLHKKALKEGKTISALVQEWVIERLEDKSKDTSE